MGPNALKLKPLCEVDFYKKYSTVTGLKTFSWFQGLFPCAFVSEEVFFTEVTAAVF